MAGMVDSFNVSVAAGILMHHAVCDRISRTVMILVMKLKITVCKRGKKIRSLTLKYRLEETSYHTLASIGKQF